VKHTDSEREGRDDDTLHLTRRERVGDNDCGDDHLHDGELGNSGHRETRLDILFLSSGGGSVLFHSLAVSGHVYYLLRK